MLDSDEEIPEDTLVVTHFQIAEKHETELVLHDFSSGKYTVMDLLYGDRVYASNCSQKSSLSYKTFLCFLKNSWIKNRKHVIMKTS